MVAHRYGRPWLGALVALLATVFLLPYIQLQITGMGVVVSTISYGAISLNWAYFIAFAVTTGVRRGQRAARQRLGVRAQGRARHRHPGLPRDLCAAALLRRVRGLPRPGRQREAATGCTLPGHGGAFGQAWFATTSVLNSLTVVIFPTTVAGYLGARSADALRRNAMLLPAYNVLLFVPMLLGHGGAVRRAGAGRRRLQPGALQAGRGLAARVDRRASSGWPRPSPRSCRWPCSCWSSARCGGAACSRSCPGCGSGRRRRRRSWWSSRGRWRCS